MFKQSLKFKSSAVEPQLRAGMMARQKHKGATDVNENDNEQKGELQIVFVVILVGVDKY